MYTEYFIEYDLELLTVYLSGLTPDNFWEEFQVFDDVNDPESFAQGLFEGFKREGKFSTIESVIIEAAD
jgi:hypothetical protein